MFAWTSKRLISSGAASPKVVSLLKSLGEGVQASVDDFAQDARRGPRSLSRKQILEDPVNDQFGTLFNRQWLQSRQGPRSSVDGGDSTVPRHRLSAEGKRPGVLRLCEPIVLLVFDRFNEPSPFEPVLV